MLKDLKMYSMKNFAIITKINLKSKILIFTNFSTEIVLKRSELSYLHENKKKI